MYSGIVVRQWRSIQGFDGVYQVSNFGEVKSYARSVYGKLLKPRRNSHGYCEVVLSVGGPKEITVHKLVLEAFACKRPSGMECAHRNGVRADNRLENLRWATPRENARDRAMHGTEVRGTDRATSKLNERDIVAIRSLSGRYSHRAIAKMFNVGKTTIGGIINRTSWKHVK